MVGFRIARAGGDSERIAINGKSLVWTREDHWLVGRYSIDIELHTSFVQCFIGYAGESISQWWLPDPSKQANPRAVIQRLFDKDNERLRKLVFPQRTRARDIESGVAILLGILGFSVLPYGAKEVVQEGPDLVAITSNHRILVIECAIDLPDSRTKLGKLQTRTQRIRDEYRSSGLAQIEILGTLVTNASRSELSAHHSEFSKAGVALVSKEDLEAILMRLEHPANPEGLFDEAKRLIPSG
jgi:hypothetical protein